jgi:hypothetical protein
MMSTQNSASRLRIGVLDGERSTTGTGRFAQLCATLEGLCALFRAPDSSWVFMAHDACRMLTSRKLLLDLFVTYDGREILEHVAIMYICQQGH